ncbi:MAG: MazG nucleotide pyrophosphohydrolase domain-containing protein [Cyanobacteria bacterium P01_H01_bin.74]
MRSVTVSEKPLPDNIEKPEAFEKTAVQTIIDLVETLRNPVSGCPWDLKQTHQSLRKYLLEESYETLEAIDNLPSQDVFDQCSRDPGTQAEIASAYGHLKEELGDVLLQVLLHSQIAKDNGQFSFETVCAGLAEKMIRRHPHVFSSKAQMSGSSLSADHVAENWAKIKQQEKRAKQNQSTQSPQEIPNSPFRSIMDEIGSAQPGLSQAYAVSKKAVSVGFKWPNFDSLWACVMSEFDEFRLEAEQLHQLENQPDPAQDDAQGLENPKALQKGALQKEKEALKEKLEEEFGDILFATVNLAREFDISPEIALSRATRKFKTRFAEMERAIAEKNMIDQSKEDSQEKQMAAMKQIDFETWDQYWREAKTHTAK